MRKLVIILAFLGFFLNAHSQGTGISVTAGVGTFNMEELKSYHSDLVSRMPVEVKTFSNFPPYTSARINLFRQNISGIKFGLNYAFSSSGQHSNYTDYSGFLDLTQIFIAHQVGASAGYRILYSDFFELLAYTDLRMAFVSNKVNMNITTSYYYDNNNLALTAISPTAEFGLNAMYHIDKIAVGLEAGYLFDTGSKFRVGSESSTDSRYPLRPLSDLHSQLSGFRAGVKLILWLNPILSEE